MVMTASTISPRTKVTRRLYRAQTLSRHHRNVFGRMRSTLSGASNATLRWIPLDRAIGSAAKSHLKKRTPSYVPVGISLIRYDTAKIQIAL